MLSNLIDSKLLNIYINRFSNFHNKKIKCMKFIFLSWKYLKLQKVNPNILIFLILSKLKVLFTVKKKKIKKRKKSRILYLPKTLNLYKGYSLGIKLFLLPYFLMRHYNFTFNFQIENCFHLFLDARRKNISIIRKKEIYFKFFKYKKYFRY